MTTAIESTQAIMDAVPGARPRAEAPADLALFGRLFAIYTEGEGARAQAGATTIRQGLPSEPEDRANDQKDRRRDEAHDVARAEESPTAPVEQSAPSASRDNENPRSEGRREESRTHRSARGSGGASRTSGAGEHSTPSNAPREAGAVQNAPAAAGQATEAAGAAGTAPSAAANAAPSSMGVSHAAGNAGPPPVATPGAEASLKPVAAAGATGRKPGAANNPVRGAIVSGSRNASAPRHAPRSPAPAKPESAEPIAVQIGRGMAAALRSGRGQVALTLRPEALGEVRVHVNVTDDRVEARVEARSAESQALLRDAVPQLRQSLEARGLEVSKIEVVLADDEPAMHGEAGGEHRGGRPSSGGHDGPAPEGMEDEIAADVLLGSLPVRIDAAGELRVDALV